MGENASGRERIRGYRNIRAYVVAEDAAMSVYRISRSFPREELYSLTSQVCRSSRSVCANIAEGWQKRRYPAAFTAKLTDAAAEAEETRVWITFAFRCGFMAADEAGRLGKTYNGLVAMLVTMANHPENWATR